MATFTLKYPMQLETIWLNMRPLIVELALEVPLKKNKVTSYLLLPTPEEIS